MKYSKERILFLSETLQAIRNVHGFQRTCNVVVDKLIEYFHAVDIPVATSIHEFKILDNTKSQDSTSVNVKSHVIVEAIASACESYSQLNIEDILRQEYQWGESATNKIIEMYASGLNRCEIDLAKRFAAKNYLLVPIVLTERIEPLWGVLMVHRCKGLDDESLIGRWNQDDGLLLHQFAMQIEIILQQENTQAILQQRLTDGEQANEVLTHWNDQYRSLIEQVPSISYISPISDTPEFAYISPQIKELLDVLDSEWTAGFFNSWVKYVHPDDRDRIQQEVRHTIETGTPFCCEYRFVTREGKTIWVQDNARMGLASDGKTQVLRGSAFNISDRKKSELRFKGIFNNTFQFTGLMSTDGVFLEANQTALDFGGISRDQVIGKLIWETYWFSISKDAQNRVQKAVKQAVEGEFIRYDIDVYGANHAIVTVDFSIRPVRDESGQVVLLIPEGRDISNLKEIERSLRRSERMLTEAQKIAKIGNWEWSVFDNETIWSDELFHLFGRDLSLAPPNYGEILEYYLEEDREPHNQAVQNAISEGQSYRLELRLAKLRPDGSYCYIEAFGHAEYDENRSPVRLYGTAQDISDRKQIEAKLISAKLAESANKAKSEFLTSMSHELRTPMNAVIGMTGILSNTPLSPDQKKYVSTIRQGGEMLLAVINDILDFSQIESGKLELEERPFKLQQCVEDVLDLMTSRIADKSLDLSVLIDLKVPSEIIGDYSRLRQILINLVSNAIKFTDKGEVALSITSKLIDPETNTYELLFNIRDTGIGLAPEAIARLFQSFSQADKSITRQYGGTGLGLVISKQLCELMGGKIDVKSVLGKGSTFSFSIQAKAIVNAETHQNVANSTNTTKTLISEDSRQSSQDLNLVINLPLEILIVEDNPVNQQVLLLMLKQIGYVAEAVNNGSKGVEAIQIKPYDAVFMDMQMPIMDGLSATKNIRKLPVSQPWIIGLSADAFTESRDAALSAGMNEYLTKPFRIEDLLGALQRIKKYAPTAIASEVLTERITTQPVIESLNMQTLKALENAIGAENLSGLIDHYIQDAEIAISKMQVALSKNDFAAIQSENHALKGTSGSFGASQLFKLCRSLECLCKICIESNQCGATDSREIAIAIQNIENEYKQVCQALKSKQRDGAERRPSV